MQLSTQNFSEPLEILVISGVFSMYSYALATRLNKDEVKCVDSRFVKSGVPNVDLSY